MTRAGIIEVDRGDFTLVKYLLTSTAEEIERSVGFEAGRLQWGFVVVSLSEDEILKPEDFELKASSRWSGGVIRTSREHREFDLDMDQNIERMLIRRGQNLAELKAKVSRFFAQRGPNTPAKVLPNLRHVDGMRYPDAEAIGPAIRSGIPQFCLLRRCKFKIIRDVP
jgi:hypothetical protein